jgi:hypothetical protein
MNMPRFTAEASLYKTSKHYQMAQVTAALKSEGAIVPQLQMRSLARPDIIVECICPCCICIDGLCFCCR